jgi:hypothetical protein
VSLAAHCANCRRELLLDQLFAGAEGFRCPFCGFPFAPAYATVAPAVAARVQASHEELVRALDGLRSMTGGRLLLDREGLLAAVAAAVPAERQPA